MGPREGKETFVFPKTDFAEIGKELRDRITAVLLLDVLEHIEQPVTFIEANFRAFPTLHSVIVTVPARQELWSNYDEHYRHFLRYDIAECRKLALRSRLSIKSHSYFFHALYVPALLVKTLGMKRKTAFGAPKASRLHGLLGNRILGGKATFAEECLWHVTDLRLRQGSADLRPPGHLSAYYRCDRTGSGDQTCCQQQHPIVHDKYD